MLPLNSSDMNSTTSTF